MAQITLLNSYNTEPKALLYDPSGEKYLNYNFNNWKDTIHYLFWCGSKKYDWNENKNYGKWCKKYGYNDGKFTGEYSEFKNKKDKISPVTISYGIIDKISCDDDYENMSMLKKESKETSVKSTKKKNYKYIYTLIKCDYFDRLFSNNKLMKNLISMNENYELGYIAGYDKKKKKKFICDEEERFVNNAPVEEENKHIDEIFKFAKENSKICGGGYIIISRKFNSSVDNDLKDEIYNKVCACFGSSVEGAFEINSKTQLVIVDVDAESG